PAGRRHEAVLHVRPLGEGDAQRDLHHRQRLVDHRAVLPVLFGWVVPGVLQRRPVLRRLLAELHLGDVPGDGDLPSPASIQTFVSPAAAPVDLQLSPSGEMFYADFSGGTIRRIVYGAQTTCPTGQFLAQYYPNTGLSGAPAVSTCEAAPLNHNW